jgi:cell division septation protein DedD
MSRLRSGRRGPQKKTSPTVKASAVMNTRNLRTRELRLSIYAAVVLIGMVTGALAVSFYLGYYSGQTVGYEIARVTDVANVARIPIAAEDQDTKTADNSVSEVYARLNEKDSAPRTTKLSEPATKDQKTADVAPILAADASPLAKDPAVAALDASDVKRDDVSNDARAQMGKGIETATKTDKKVVDAAKDSAKENVGTDELNDEVSQDVQKNPAIKVLGGPAPKAEQAQNGDTAQTKNTKIQVAALTDTTKNQAKGSAVNDAKKDSHAKVDIKPTTTSTLAKGWFAQVAAPRKQADADVLIKQLRASGFKTSVEHAQVRGEDYFRVLVGPEDNRTQAERLTAQLGREKYIKGEPFVRLVK